MKKLFFIIFIIQLSFFSGCKKEQLVDSPEEMGWQDPNAGGPHTYTVDLVQNLDDDLGEVRIDKLADGGIRITYKIDSLHNCMIDDIAIDLARSSGIKPLIIDFHSSSVGPEYLSFDSKRIQGITIEGIRSKEVTVSFSYNSLLEALGGTIPSKIYLTVHGELSWINTQAVENLCPDLSSAQGSKLNTVFLLGSELENSSYYFDILLDKPIIGDKKDFYGWCLDAKRTFPSGETGVVDYHSRPLNFICSYDNIDTCLINFTGNLKKANWVINNRCSYDGYAVQAALWTLLSNYDDWKYNGNKFYDSKWRELLADTAGVNIENWTPQCGEKILIIGYEPSDNLCNDNLLQVFGIEVSVCGENRGSALAYPYPADDFSASYPGASQYRYFSFNY